MFFFDVITRTDTETLHLYRHLLNNSHFQVLAVALFGAVTAEAEADADAFYGYYGYAAHPYAYGYYGYPYAYGHYAHYGKSAPCVNAANVPVPCAAGYYGKRSAEAEAAPAADAEADADAFYGYYGYAHHPYAYGYAHHGYYGYPYAYHGYPYGYYGKRSADAEPEAEAEADAAVLYGAYGYPYGLGAYGAFGYAGYPYAYGLHYGGIAATNAALGHAVAYTAGGVTHSSNVGVCTNYLGAQVPC